MARMFSDTVHTFEQWGKLSEFLEDPWEHDNTGEEDEGKLEPGAFGVLTLSSNHWKSDHVPIHSLLFREIIRWSVTHFEINHMEKSKPPGGFPSPRPFCVWRFLRQ